MRNRFGALEIQQGFKPAALAIADRGYGMETGTITLSGTGQKLISNEQVHAAHLGM